ncbi:bifunctional 5,10-methylenetetrahydrofolate dehydrogenase/5,10-methenyltetrahydrofolate cyclohydrolase [Candidatus Saccharibacteria bacterium]|nr:bifunctional 5,10-methylenetetrahydrofolate dehydrogenase/5,10-methenyltetrahydrofolate cyclohydrolase [Candidatus Saccharibacteria bacterium]
MKLLSGSELAGFIKERQAKAVRGLRQAYNVAPKLAIIVAADNPVIDLYVRLKKQYGADILIDVDVHKVDQSNISETVAKLNIDDSVHGIIVQLPLADPSKNDEVLSLVDPSKDVDALGLAPDFDAATPTAILWLLAGYNVNLLGKSVVLVGHGKLVGEPLQRMLENSGVQVKVCVEGDDVHSFLKTAEVIITATGKHGVISSVDIPPGAVVVDAGVAVESGKTVGDLHPDVYERDDISVTPQKGGVGPLTICALFENVISAAKCSAGIDTKAV